MAKTFDLASYNISRPLKLNWCIPLEDMLKGDPLLLIKSQSQRKFLSHIDELFAKHGISYELLQLGKPQFLKWLPYYQANMTAHGY